MTKSPDLSPIRAQLLEMKLNHEKPIFHWFKIDCVNVSDEKL